MLFWVIFIFIVLVFIKNPTKKGMLKPETWLTLIFVLLVLCIRFDVGYDYFSYYYTALGPPSIIESRDMELFDYIIFIFCYKVFDWPPLVFIIYGIITLIPAYYILYKYSSNFKIAIITYISFFYLTDMGLLRQAVAITIVLCGYKYLINYNLGKYLLCCLIAYFFHNSAVCAIFIPLIYRYFNWKSTIVSLITIFIVFGIILKPIIELLEYENYLERLDELKGGGIMMYFNVILIAILLFLVRKKKKIQNYNLFYILTIGCVMPFLIGGHLGARISSYFLVYLCFLIPEIFKQYKLNERSLCCFALSIFFILNIYVSTKSPSKSPFTPYQTIFQVDDFHHPHFKPIKIARR